MLNKKLQISQLDRKMKPYKRLASTSFTESWIKTVRLALGMSLKQLGNKMGITAQSVRSIEEREKNGTISLKSLKKVAKALDLELVYGLAPIDESLEKMIEYRATKLAYQITNRTHRTMSLENQANSHARLKKAIKERSLEIINNDYKILWD
jgi:predicted DNA-binding mobile mystery protein A